MPTPISYPLINGVRYDFSSVELNFNGTVQRAGIKSLSYKHSLTPGELRGNRPQIVGRTRGKYEASASFEMFKTEYQQFIFSIGAFGYMEKAFDITACWADPSNLSQVVMDVIKGCRIKNDEDTGQEGGEAQIVKVELSVLNILRNGVVPFNPFIFLR
jgi:hypothetical protein